MLRPGSNRAGPCSICTEPSLSFEKTRVLDCARFESTPLLVTDDPANKTRPG